MILQTTQRGNPWPRNFASDQWWERKNQRALVRRWDTTR